MNNLYNPTSRSKQTNNYLPYYPENPNAFMDGEVEKAQHIGLSLATENPIGAGIVNAMVNGVIGEGLKLETFIDKTLLKGVSESRIAKIQETIESYWKTWSQSPEMCDFYGQNSLGGIESIALKAVVSEGDGLLNVKIVKDGSMYYPQIQWIDGLYVATPPDKYGQKNIVNGVEIDDKGRDVAYWVKESKGNDLNITYKRCKAKSHSRDYNQFTLIRFNEIQQGLLRGRSLLTAAKELLIQSNRFIESEVTKAVLQASFTMFITKEKDVIADPNTSVTSEFENAAREANSEDRQIEESDEEDRAVTVRPGAVNELNPGEGIVTSETKAPTAAFNEFINTVLTLVGMSVNIPYEKLKKVYNSNYSASQASIQEASIGFNAYRRDFATKFMRPIYIAFVDTLVLQGLIDCPEYETNIFARNAWRGSIWYGSPMLNIDPVKNIKTSIMSVNAGLSTKEQETRKLNGGDYQSNIKRRAQEVKYENKMMPEDTKVESTKVEENPKDPTTKSTEEG